MYLKKYFDCISFQTKKGFVLKPFWFWLCKFKQ